MFERRMYLSVLVLPFICGCDSLMMELADEVEVAPNKWITVNQWATQLIISRGDETLTWKEEGDETPVTLREWEDKLFLITFDRSNFNKIRFRYYAESGDGFKEIEPDDFPKRIATQNLWLTAESNGATVDGPVYPLELVLNLDPEEIWFCRSLTGMIWCQLMTGKEYWEIEETVEPQPLVREFSKKYKPIKLTAIIRKDGQEKVE